VVSLSEIDAYSEAIDSLSAVAFAQLKALLLSLDNPNPIVFRDALLATYPELLAPFTTAASLVAASWYSTLRANAGITGTFAPVLAPPPPTDQLDAGVRYSLTPLFQPEKFIGSDILTLLAGFTQRMIADAGRDTISGSATQDPTRVGYQRVPRAGACAFCSLLASRGAVYRSAESAGGVVGRGVDASETAGKVGGQGKGVNPRGSQAIGSKYHNHCRCVVAPKFPGADNDYLNYVEQHFEEIHAKALKEIGSDGTLEGVTAAIRELTGSK
jgi:hypothetical protein